MAASISLSAVFAFSAFCGRVVKCFAKILFQHGNADFPSSICADKFLYIGNYHPFIDQDGQRRLHFIQPLSNSARKSSIFTLGKLSCRLHQIFNFNAHADALPNRVSGDHSRTQSDYARHISKQSSRVPTIVGNAVLFSDFIASVDRIL